MNRKYLNNDFYGLTFSSNYSLKKKLKVDDGRRLEPVLRGTLRKGDLGAVRIQREQ